MVGGFSTFTWDGPQMCLKWVETTNQMRAQGTAASTLSVAGIPSKFAATEDTETENLG